MEALERGESVTVTIDGDLVILRSLEDLKALGEGEIGWCDYLDREHAYVDEADFPTEWTCPECGGTTFEFIHADYPASNLKGTTFRTETEEDDA
jgi:hypothetical protein